MIYHVGIQLIDSAIAAIAVGDMIPDSRAGISDSAIVLSAGHHPVPGIRVAGEIFDLGDAEAFVERFPIRASVRRSKNAAVIAGVNDIGIVGRESQAVLVRMYALRTLYRNVGPCPGRARKISAQRLDGTEIYLSCVVRRGRDIPVIPGLAH